MAKCNHIFGWCGLMTRIFDIQTIDCSSWSIRAYGIIFGFETIEQLENINWATVGGCVWYHVVNHNICSIDTIHQKFIPKLFIKCNYCIESKDGNKYQSTEHNWDEILCLKGGDWMEIGENRFGIEWEYKISDI